MLRGEVDDAVAVLLKLDQSQRCHQYTLHTPFRAIGLSETCDAHNEIVKMLLEARAGPHLEQATLGVLAHSDARKVIVTASSFLR